mmetsp:Transcript_22345/g.49563  ORF Transcript_22345/g.49563 Transcript_22345/m.49563 type:complete len:174 (+) Transcript_22345:286-807(+)
MQRGRTVTNSRFEPLRLVADRIMGASRRGTSALRTAALPPVSGASDSESSDSDLFRCETPSPDREPPRDEDDDDDSGDDDDDGPVVVSPEEIEASLARSSGRGAATARGPRSGGETEAHHGFREGYPLLAAAMAPFEDVPMLCARVLDERKDVSLVREAAAYLEEAEQSRGGF